MKPFATCLGIILVGLALSAPAYGSYRDGAWGFFIVLYSLPVAVAATLCTLLCWSFELFKKQWFLRLYCLSSIVAALAAVGLSLSANDPTSLLFAVIGESVLLVPVLLPAVFQYAHSRKPAAAAQQSVEADRPAAGGPAA